MRGYTSDVLRLPRETLTIIKKHKNVLRKAYYVKPKDMQEKFALPIYWNDHEDIAMGLYEKFGDDFDESKIYRIRFTDLLEWVLSIPDFKGTREQSTEGHLEQIQSAWVYEWRDNQ